MLKYLRVLSIFYRRNFSKNVILVLFTLLTNLTLSLFLIFNESSAAILPRLNESYFEELSVDLSKYGSAPTNNELINVKTYERPSLVFINSLMERTGPFMIRPDYTFLFQKSKLHLFAKELSNPLFVTHMVQGYGIGINRAYYEFLRKEVALHSENFKVALTINTKLMIESKEVEFSFSDELEISFIYDEPTVFTSPKLYLPETYLDTSLGRTFLFEDVSLTNYLLNLNPTDELANRKFRCHLRDRLQLEKLKKIINELSSTEDGYEISADYLAKVASFTALYEYLKILMTLLLWFVIIATLIISVVIAHTSLMASLRQMALLVMIGAKKSDLYVLYFLLLSFNFLLGLVSLTLLPSIIPFLNTLLFSFLHFEITLTISIYSLISTFSFLYLFLLLIISLIFVFNLRRPLLYLLIDA